MLDVEMLAKELHEARRAAIEAGASDTPKGGRFLLGWDDITDRVREGWRIQARHLLEKFRIDPK